MTKPILQSAFGTVIPSRSPRRKAHIGLGYAKSAITGRLYGSAAIEDMPAIEDMSILQLDPGSSQYVMLHNIRKGTLKSQLPWQRKEAMNPFRIVRSEAELEAVATDSLVCPASHPGTIFEKAAPNEWVEPGSDDTFPTASVWEVMTGAYGHLVLDEDREVWVLIDAAAPKLVRPLRPEPSPNYATRVSSHTPEMATHATLKEARAATGEAVGDGATVGHTNIWGRGRDEWLLHPVVYMQPGTAVADFPWKSASAVTM